MAQNTSLKLIWLWSLSPFLQLEHMALILQIPLLNFNMGARHNPLSHCRYGDGYGCPWHAAYHGESKAVANFGHWYSPPFSWSVWQVATDKQRVGSFISSLATDTERLATDKQLVWQQTIRLRVLKFTLVPRPLPSTWTWLSLFKSLKSNLYNALVSHSPIQSLMSIWPTKTSLKLKWLSSLSPFLQLEHMALTLQIPLLNFNMGRGITTVTL